MINEALFYGLVLLSAATSLLTAVAGAGGGAVLIGVMALVLPGSAVIPVHGLVQMGSFALARCAGRSPRRHWSAPRVIGESQRIHIGCGCAVNHLHGL